MEIDVRVYLASPMTGYDRPVMIKRAHEMIALGKRYGVTVISPVVEERISGIGELAQKNELKLYTFWKRDKQIIRNRNGEGAHVVLIDGAEKKSLGCEREYALNRYCLWKPTVCLLQRDGFHVANFEDDRVFKSEADAFKFIASEYGTHMQRIQWRIRMLARSLPGFIIDQIAAWR